LVGDTGTEGSEHHEASRRISLGFLVVFCVLVAGTMPVFAVYVDNLDGTVTDSTTNLVWQKAEDGVTRNEAGADAFLPKSRPGRLF